MRVAPDGSPVELYLNLPERTAEARLIDTMLDPHSEILDLGCGTGRLAEPLSRAGHAVVGGEAAEQRFSARDVDDAILTDLAAVAGLRIASVLNESATLVALRPVADNQP